MAKTMKAAIVRAFDKPIEVDEVPVPELRSDRVLVKIDKTGVCHTDLHAAEGDWPVKPTPPFIPGHEGVGHVVEIGKDVKGIKEGDRVGIPWLHTACGRCEYCIGGWETLCPFQENSGYSVDGTFAEYCLADPSFVGFVPDGLDSGDAGPVLCAGVTVYKGLKVTEARPGQWVVISGIGGLGHMAVQYARAMGLKVAAVDVRDDKLRLAEELGATLTVNAMEEDPVERMEKELGGAHAVLVTAVGNKAFEQAIGMVRRGGTVSLVGLPPGTFDLPIFDLVLTGKTVRGSIVGDRNDLSEALQLAADGLARPRYTTEKLDDIRSIFDRMRSGDIEGRIVVEM